ncbi:MAG: flagellar export chaperone FliS [Leptospiraceae bacterium]|nr:flagellar export chaperone FliS [Leptospiraceae bacterium]MCB1315323.1 flagellar export chaperone FliS [Leptospiraceae bacterium]MCB1319474.1 flagellar export chaperone FliS [Leptospiraceae bacterium]
MALSRANQYKAYKDTEISTANQGKLIVMLYDGALRFLRLAIDNMDPRSYDVVNLNIIKAQDIVTELMLSLNMNEGGEIAENLFSIYAYLKKRLLEANIAKDAGILEEVCKLLLELKGAWDEVALKDTEAPVSPRAEIRQEGASFSIQG